MYAARELRPGGRPRSRQASKISLEPCPGYGFAIEPRPCRELLLLVRRKRYPGVDRAVDQRVYILVGNVRPTFAVLRKICAIVGAIADINEAVLVEAHAGWTEVDELRRREPSRRAQACHVLLSFIGFLP